MPLRAGLVVLAVRVVEADLVVRGAATLLAPPVMGSHVESAQREENPYSPLLVRQLFETTVFVPSPTPAPPVVLFWMVSYWIVHPRPPS